MSQLGDGDRPFAMGPFGSRIRTENFRPSGVPVIRGKILVSNRFDDSHVVFVDHAKAEELAASIARPGDLVFTYRGTLEQVALIPRRPRYPLYLVSQSQMKATLNEAIVLPEYAYYWFCSPEGQRALLRNTSQTGVPAINQPLASPKTIRIPLPPLSEQQAIAEVLGALDHKIEANQQVAELCDALWQTVAAEVLDDIEHGVVTSGDLRPLSSIATFVNGKAFTKNATGTGRMVVRIAELNGGPGPSTIYSEIEVPAKHIAAPGDLLFAWSGSLTVQRWYRPEAIINQHIFKVVPQSNIPTWCIHAHLLRLLPAFRRIAAGTATTMGHIQRHDLDVKVGVPNSGRLARLDSVCAPLWHRALRAEMETLNLSRLRETLLPKLVSGELRVRCDDIEALIEVSR